VYITVAELASRMTVELGPLAVRLDTELDGKRETGSADQDAQRRRGCVADNDRAQA
jgi:hypothetical protein